MNKQEKFAVIEKAILAHLDVIQKLLEPAPEPPAFKLEAGCTVHGNAIGRCTVKSVWNRAGDGLMAEVERGDGYCMVVRAAVLTVTAPAQIEVGDVVMVKRYQYPHTVPAVNADGSVRLYGLDADSPRSNITIIIKGTDARATMDALDKENES